MNFYSKEIYLAQVDKQDNVIGRVERWEAHKKGILHRGFTVCLFYKGQAILQHRKHPVFDKRYDLTCSSHPFYKNGSLQTVEEAVKNAVLREWNIKKINKLSLKGKTYYKAADNLSAYGEHEICYSYTGEINSLPDLNLDFAYGFSLVDLKTLKDPKFPLKSSFAPWVKYCLDLL